MFKERRDAKTEIKVTGAEPIIYINPKALDKMALYVQGCDKEIGWLGKATKNENIYIIHDVYLFKQEVHSATCELTPEGLSDFVLDMYTNHTDIADEVVNNLRLWGHSHVNMGVSPSSQDDNQMDSFKESNPWFLRVIANKSGEMEFSLYDYEQQVQFKNVKWFEYRANEFSLQDEIKAEIALKVKEKSFATVQYGSKYAGKEWSYIKGEWVQDAKPSDLQVVKNKKYDKKAKSQRGVWNKALDMMEWYDEIEEIDKVEDTGLYTPEFIDSNFTEGELKNISACENLSQVDVMLEYIDIDNRYNMQDAMTIYDYAQNKYPAKNAI